MLRFRNFVQGSLFAALAAFGYAQTDSIYLLLTAAWLAGFGAWNVFECVLQVLGDRNRPFERYVATHHLSIPTLGLVLGTFSVVANSTIESHWFLLAHGIFWIIFGIFLLAIMFFLSAMAKAVIPKNREEFFQGVLLPAFEANGAQVRNVLTERYEMNITSIWHGRSFAFIDVHAGPFTWINFREDRVDENTALIEYGVRTLETGRILPKVRIRSERVRSFPIVGKITDVRWRGNDFGLGLIDRLNDDESLRQPMVDGFGAGSIKGDVRIDAHPESDHWILTEKTRSITRSKELWDCYQAIAEKLPERRNRFEAAAPKPGPQSGRRLSRQERRHGHRKPVAPSDPIPMTYRQEVESQLGRPLPRWICIGGTPARITRITQKLLEFVDEVGGRDFIDLERCNENWISWRTKMEAGCDIVDPMPVVGQPDRYIGIRGALCDAPWIRFWDKPGTMFQFSSRDDLYQITLDPLAELGWLTLDND